MNLPLLQNPSLMMTKWKSILDNLLRLPLSSSLLLKNQQLFIGSNPVNHKLGRDLQGWIIVRKRGPADIYDTQDENQTPQLTLLLTSSAKVLVDLLVF